MRRNAETQAIDLRIVIMLSAPMAPYEVFYEFRNQENVVVYATIFKNEMNHSNLIEDVELSYNWKVTLKTIDIGLGISTARTINLT